MKSIVRAVFIHVILWGVYILSEFIGNIAHYADWEHYKLWRNILISLPGLMLPTYFIAYFLVPRYLQKAKYLPFVIGALGMAVFVFYSRIYGLTLINYLEDGRYFHLPASKVAKNVIRDYAVIALAVCLKIIGDWQKKDQLNRQLYRAKAEAEIKFLKAQLHPHFLFNTLNNIYTLAYMKADNAPIMIEKLSDIMRYMLYDCREEKVPLTKEVKYLEDFIRLQSLQIEDRGEVKVSMDGEFHNYHIAPLILIVFVENCFKHSTSSLSDMIFIDISLAMVNDELTLKCSNSFASEKNTQSLTKGIGLENVKSSGNCP